MAGIAMILQYGIRLLLKIALMTHLLTGCAQEPMPSNLELTNLFIDNRSTFTEIKMFCISNPAVIWLGKEDVSLAPEHNSVDISQNIHHIRELLKSIGAESVTCSRDWSKKSFPLIAVSIPLYTAGWSVGGKVKGIDFISESSEHVKARVSSGELEKLQDDWYIFLHE